MPRSDLRSSQSFAFGLGCQIDVESLHQCGSCFVIDAPQASDDRTAMMLLGEVGLLTEVAEDGEVAVAMAKQKSYLAIFMGM